ncbi:alanine racemase [Parashewanella tropica]|uniref:alanine racemase n=1 Tax=Parashewanella tropica TaxID=2547970 RepID=UPI00105A44C1|nr:alanine racemase [Parashewanella tropica]
MKPFPRAEVSCRALKQNLQQLKIIAPNSKVMAVVKANGYGHGLINVAKCLDEADGFGLARLKEALMLRDAGIQQKLLLLEGFFHELDLHKLVDHNIETVVHHESQVEMLEQATLPRPIRVWLKLDSGMNRLGVTAEEFSAIYQRLVDCPNVEKPIHLMTHFACADEPENNMTQEQLQLFESLTQHLEGERTLSNSAATLYWSQAHGDWVRPGIALYGVSPVMGDLGTNHQLTPAMELKSQLISVKSVKANESVGYGAYWQAQQQTTLGVVAIGYGDGYPRNAPEGTPVWVNGRRVPIVGRVSMDMLTVDLGVNAQDKVGDEATLWGKDLPVEEVAEHIGTIAYELMTKLTPRVAVCLE